MDRSEQILQEIVSICEGLGVPVDLDRVQPVDDSECPRFVVRTGEEQLDPPEGARPETVGRRWMMLPQVEFYNAGSDPAALRTTNVQMWSNFRAAFFQSPVLEMLSHGTLPAIERNMTSPSQHPNVSGFFIDLALTFDRRD
ncbi:hypothetical protein DLJ49_18770 [Rhodovulum sp. 12E13]|uniref:hypothetical protein n=1 Tax=Rhodovulum sp. 12E13 TaxID=2203891 RepID=UPI000E164111|nr:hypothetical protein [Rhodovulum sp. 12E13]RDC69683.1 hypothetical protein DLJ49_18770 [Rhodovulum sp. 12E13]